jgi:hypothetical protein
MNKNLKLGLMALVVTGIGSVANASYILPLPSEAINTGSIATPVAMCGFYCRSGGRYIPGPPGVCYARGLNYCGPSRGYGPPPWAGRGFYGPPRYYGGPPSYGPRRYGW